MNLDKLPRSQPAEDAPAANVPPADPVLPYTASRPAPAENAAANVLIDLLVAVVIASMSWAIFDYAIHLITGRPFGYTQTDTNGNTVPYTSSQFFLPQLACGLFAVLLVIDAAASWTRSRLVRGSLAGAFAAVGVLNVIADVVAQHEGWGPQLLPIVCAAMAVYWAAIHVKALRGGGPAAA